MIKVIQLNGVLLGLVAALLFASPVFANASSSERVRVNIVFNQGGDAGGRAALDKVGGRIMLAINEVHAVSAEVPLRALAALSRSKHVRFVELDTMQHTMANADPSGPPYELGQLVPYGIKMVEADQLSDALSSGRRLCIIDSGIDIGHPDHAGNILNGENLTTSGDWFTDENSHGTHVAGTVAAVNQPNVGVVGVLPNKQIDLHILKVFDVSGSTSSSNVALAMVRCWRAGSNVISMSLGGSVPSRLQRFVARFLAARNVLMVAAAGNGGNNTVSYPAGFAEVVSVAAVDQAKARASFSQFNADVEWVAPGVDVLSTVPVGTGISGTLDVAGTNYDVIPMEGSPTVAATSMLYDFGFGDALDPGAAGKVCLISRGNITFADKVLNCQNSGGVAAVIYNNVPGPLNGTLGGVVTTIPSVGANGDDAAALLAQLGSVATVAVAASDYASFNGTSMATPHASAVAALVWSYFPACNAAELRTSISNSSEDLGAAGRDDEYGFGLVLAKAAHDRIAALGCGL